jgi:hypothetical protein
MRCATGRRRNTRLSTSSIIAPTATTTAIAIAIGATTIFAIRADAIILNVIAHTHRSRMHMISSARAAPAISTPPAPSLN